MRSSLERWGQSGIILGICTLPKFPVCPWRCFVLGADLEGENLGFWRFGGETGGMSVSCSKSQKSEILPATQAQGRDESHFSRVSSSRSQGNESHNPALFPNHSHSSHSSSDPSPWNIFLVPIPEGLTGDNQEGFLWPEHIFMDFTQKSPDDAPQPLHMCTTTPVPTIPKFHSWKSPNHIPQSYIYGVAMSS